MIIGKKVVLEQYKNNADIIQFCTWTKDKELLFQFAPSLKYPVSFETMKKRINHSKSNYVYPSILKVIDKLTGKHIGHAEFTRSHLELHRCSTLSHLLVAEFDKRNQGYGEDIVNTLLNHLFIQLKVNRIDLFVLPENIPAIKCYSKCGFQREGILRQCLKFEDQYYSLLAMSIVYKEWQNILSKKREAINSTV